MSDNTTEMDGFLGCLGMVAGFFFFALLIGFLQWLWGVLVAMAIWIWFAPGRLALWILGWPLLSGHLLLALLAIAALGVVFLLLFEFLIRLAWPRQFLSASNRASQMLQGLPIRSGGEVMQLHFVEFCDHSSGSASVKLFRCMPRLPGRPDRGIRLDSVSVEGISVQPDQALFSRRLRTLRQPTRTYLESFQRHGLEPLATDSIEAKAWQALQDSEQELAKLGELRGAACSMLKDAKRVQQFTEDNELLSPTRKRSLALIPKLTTDVSRIDARCLELRRFGYKLYEFINIPKSLRSFEMSDDIEASMLAQRGLSDELFEEIQLIEQAYGEVLGIEW